MKKEYIEKRESISELSLAEQQEINGGIWGAIAVSVGLLALSLQAAESIGYYYGSKAR